MFPAARWTPSCRMWSPTTTAVRQQHWRGWPVGSKANPDQDTSVYEHGVLTDVHDELMRQVDGVLAAGVKPERIIIDPGLGFQARHRA